MDKIALDKLNAGSEDDFVRALGDVFEHTPGLARAVYAKRPFGSLGALYEAMESAVRGQSRDEQVRLLQAHPDLAGKAARAGTLTADSKAEQSSAGLDQLSEDEYTRFHKLNEEYRKKFGIPFIVCVRRHGRDSILREFDRRLGNDAATEEKAALTEVLRIAALRLDQRVSATDRLKVNGRLSTHVLDVHSGRPAQGIAVELLTVPRSGPPVVLARALTNADGRTEKPLLADQPIPIAAYELRFSVGPYFATKDIKLADPPFLDTIPLRFSVAEPEGHYHVPLLLTPWGYSTYRGS
jgi:2-oxo-4-hydroxy-4-carboxy-5-ureidoimidazoline decarboxylase